MKVHYKLNITVEGDPLGRCYSVVTVTDDDGGERHQYFESAAYALKWYRRVKEQIGE